MLYLLDPNVVSELRKGSRCDSAVSAWEQAELIPHGGAVSVITIGEIRKGIDLIARRDPPQAAGLESGSVACSKTLRTGFFLLPSMLPKNGGG